MVKIGDLLYADPNGSELKAVFQQSEVKINAGNSRKGIVLDIPGIISIDTRTLLMKD